MGAQEHFTARHGRPLLFGEVLFDQFPDGTAVLGGAPFNVAWHLQGFGLAPLLISGIGADPRGAQVLEAMRAWGMDTAGIQMDAAHPTGTVSVDIDRGQPTFSILPDQAYDHVEAEAAAAQAPSAAALLYHGTLALRHPVTRAAFHRLRECCPAPTWVDVNLRAPWWDAATVADAVGAAAWVKLNHHELAEIAQAGPLRGAAIPRAAQALRERYGLECLIVTVGEDGAYLVTERGVTHGRPERVAEIADAVGAGDAFSAVVVLGLVRGWSLTHTLERAMEFAARICTVRGATVRDPALYRDCLRRWERAGDA